MALLAACPAGGPRRQVPACLGRAAGTDAEGIGPTLPGWPLTTLSWASPSCPWPEGASSPRANPASAGGQHPVTAGPVPGCPQFGTASESSASLYTGANSNLRDRALGEVGRDGFIALPGKGGRSGLLPRKTMRPNPGGSDEGL